MRRPPVPRRGVYNLYWYFASERQRIFERRVAGDAGPWTDDPILQAFKFCNVFRAADRVSQFLLRNVAYGNEHVSPEDRIFQVVAFRLFSRIETWRTLIDLLGHAPTLEDLVSGAFETCIERVRQKNGRLYTGAFILCAAKAYGESLKHLNHVRLLQHMFVGDRLAVSLLGSRSLGEMFRALRTYPLIGDFMAYQCAIDLNYTEFFDFSENDFTRPGPGALRGIKKVFESVGEYSPEDVVQWMVARQDDEFRRLRLPFGGLWGRRLHAIDCQGLFCETDKYCREARPELASNRKRIKARFVASREPLALFFPPKWKVDPRGAGIPASPFALSGTSR